VVQWAMQADDIGFGQKLIESWNILDSVLFGSLVVWIDIVGNDVASKAMRKNLSCQQTDPTGANQADSLLVQVEAEETIQEEVAFTDSGEGLVVLPDDSQDHSDGKFSHCLRRIGRDTAYFNSKRFSLFKVDIIEPC